MLFLVNIAIFTQKLTLTQKIGHRILLVEVRTNFVATAFMGSLLKLVGGSIYKPSPGLIILLPYLQENY